MFKHFIITRFNLRTVQWDKTKNNEDVLTKEWQKHRLQMFREFCFPSVVNQANQNFIWLVYFDTHSPDFIMKDIEKMKTEFKNFVPKFLDEMELIKTEVKTDMMKYFDQNTTHVITSRLDNDDAIQKNYVLEIQNAFDNQNICVVDPEIGICLQTTPTFLLSRYRTTYSPFVSLIEKIENFRTVLSKSHNQWNEINSVRKITDSIMWLQVIHGKNLFNSIMADKYLSDKKILNDFGINSKKFNTGLLYSVRVFYLNFFLIVKNTLRRIKN